ncbi:MAG: hypothetical protein H7336_08145 [Bacteriovorax sp.]|nr:hypothetical protein [Bacteriovorax sp.]
MSGKLLSPKYLAVLLLAVVFLFLLSFDVFSATEISFAKVTKCSFGLYSY